MCFDFFWDLGVGWTGFFLVEVWVIGSRVGRFFGARDILGGVFVAGACFFF